MKTYDFIAFLISRRLLKKFIQYWAIGQDLQDVKLAFIDYLNRNDPGSYVCSAFSWTNTREDHNFWKEIDSIWYNKVKGYKPFAKLA